MNKPVTTDDEWMRLPKPRERCPITKLSRTSLVEILDERDPETGEYLVKQMRKERHGKQRRIRLIHKASLLAYMDGVAAKQNGLQLASDLNNPTGETVESILGSFEVFQLFIGVDNLIHEEEWEFGRLASRQQRIAALVAKGVFVRPKPPSSES